MKIVGLYAENFKKLKAVTIIPGSDNIIKITGGNEEGKSTVLEAIWAALGGKKFVPEVPIRTGEKKAIVSLELGDLTVTRKMTANSDSLEVTNKDGAVYKSPQAILDRIINGLSFDPLSFTKMDKQKRVETLLSVVDLKVDDEQLKAISTVPRLLETKNPLDKIKAAYDFIYKERADVNRDLEKAKSLLESLPEVEKNDPVSLTELVQEKEQLEAVNRENQKKRDAVKEQERIVTAVEVDITEINAEIQRLREQLVAKNELLEEECTKYNNLYEATYSLQDNDLTDINQRIASADETNKKAQAYEKREAVRIGLEQLQADSNSRTAILEQIKAYKQKLLSTANFPVPDLSFGDDGITYQGLPFEQASSAQKLLVSMSIAAALHPELNVITIDEAEKLDAKHWKIVEDFATEKGLQVWATIVDTSGKIGIVIEDGEIVAGADQTAQ
jgi:DNA repair exonuclease SbcCD ATPase subunit